MFKATIQAIEKHQASFGVGAETPTCRYDAENNTITSFTGESVLCISDFEAPLATETYNVAQLAKIAKAADTESTTIKGKKGQIGLVVNNSTVFFKIDSILEDTLVDYSRMAEVDGEEFLFDREPLITALKNVKPFLDIKNSYSDLILVDGFVFGHDTFSVMIAGVEDQDPDNLVLDPDPSFLSYLPAKSCAVLISFLENSEAETVAVSSDGSITKFRTNQGFLTLGQTARNASLAKMLFDLVQTSLKSSVKTDIDGAAVAQGAKIALAVADRSQLILEKKGKILTTTQADFELEIESDFELDFKVDAKKVAKNVKKRRCDVYVQAKDSKVISLLFTGHTDSTLSLVKTML